MARSEYLLPPSFSLSFDETGELTFHLSTSQVIPVPIERAFSFFENPGNLAEITPDWLCFRMVGDESGRRVYEGACFDYTIRWFGLPVRWRSRIALYEQPRRFVDEQLEGPYRLWSHHHAFEAVDAGTRVADHVTYRLPLGLIGKAAHSLVVRDQLRDIFCYRAVRIAEWAGGHFTRKTGLHSRESSVGSR